LLFCLSIGAKKDAEVSMDKENILKIFRASPTPTSIIEADAPNFTFIAVNEAYCRMTQVSEDQLIDKSLFEAFPENPDESKPTGIEKLKGSFLKVIATKNIDELDQLRYDIILEDGEFKQVFWKVINTPILDEEGSVEFIINTATNITQQVLSERENTLMLNNTEDSFVLIDRNLIIKNFNSVFAETYKDIFGIDVQKGDSILDYAHPERRIIVKEIYARVFEGEIVEGDLPIVTKQGDTRFFSIKYKPAINESGDIVGSFISLLENTEEQLAKLELEQSEARFRALAENGSDILFILNEEGKPTYSSPSIHHVLGYTQEEALSLDMFEKVHPDDIPMMQAEIAKCLDKPGEPIKVPPARLKDKEGNWHWFEGTITNMFHEPVIGGIVDNFREITDRVESDHKVQRAKNQYQSLIQTIDGIIWEAGTDDFIFNYVSPQAKEILGYEPDEWIGVDQFWQSRIHPDDKQEAIAYCQLQIEKEINHTFEYRMRHKDDHYLWIRDIVTIVKESGGAASSIRGMMIDITQEKSLESKLDQAYELAKIGPWELDLINERLHWSDYVKELHEVDKKYEPDLDVAINFYKEGWSRDKITEAVNNAIESGIPFDIELIIITAKGDEKWVRAVGKPDFQNNKCLRIYGATQDITERKRAQIEKEQAEEKYRNVVEHSTNMFYQHDMQGVLNYVSPQSETFLGYPAEEAMRNWSEFITDHPINKEGEKHTLRTIETGEIQDSYELELIKADGQIIWVEVNESPLKKNGKVVSIVGSLTDITDRKKYEKKLKQSLERYDYVSKASLDAIYDWDLVNETIHWGDGFNTLFGHRAGEEKYLLKNWGKLVHSDDIKKIRSNLEYTLADSSMDSWASEYRFKKAEGGYAFVSENGYIIRDEDGKAIRMIGALRDVTESKRFDIQNEIQREIAHFFKEKENLGPILKQTLGYLANYGKFETAEIWLKSSNNNYQNLIANHPRNKKGEVFYESSTDISQFAKGEGLPGSVWESKKIEIWDDIASKTPFVRKNAAKKAGLRSAFGIPLFHKEEFTGVLLLCSAADVSANAQTLKLFEALQEFLGAEIKRKQQEEESQLLFKSAPEILAVATPNGYFSRVNPAFCDLLGYSEIELISRPLENFLHPEDRENTLREYEETKTGERQTENFVNRYVTKSGETVYISWYSSDIFGEDELFFAYGRDVTETVELEKLLQLTNRLAKVGSWELKLMDNDENGDSMYWSDMTRVILEVEDDYNPTLPGGFEFYEEDSKKVIQKAVDNAIENGTPFDEELKIVTAKDNSKWIRCIGDAEFIEGNCVRIFGSLQDITDKKTAEIEFEKAFKEKETILESIGDGFFTLSNNWIVTYWNQAAERMLHTPKQKIIGQNLWDIFPDAVDLPSYTNYHRALHQQINVDFEDYYPSLEKWFEISAYPSPDGISVFFKDITERKKASKELEKLNIELEIRARELAASNEELEQFAYVASHDLQEPLRMVSSFLTQLEKKYSDSLDEKAKDYIHYAVDGAQRMRQIILDLLNYSRLNKDKAKREKTDLNKLLEDAKSLERSHMLEKEAEITSDKLPVLEVNPGAIEQVFRNLLNNAIKYTQPNVVPKIAIHAEELDTHWKFSFSDNGIGINEEFKDTIFQIFQRLHTRDHYSGTGIGLAISKKIIERHEGKIWVESKEGKGSTFHFTIKK